MQRTIRILRVALPIVFFGFIILIAVSWNRARVQKDRSINQPVTSTIRPVDKPQIESKTFEDTQTIAGRLAARIRAKRVVAFQSGWNTLEDVQLTIYRPTGLTYEVMCPQAQFNSETKEADAKGGVHVTSSDGVEINTAEIHFDGNRLTNHVAVQFTIDRWRGNAGALDLDVQAEMLRLYDKLAAEMTPEDPAEGVIHLNSPEATFRRKENIADFSNGVVFTRDADHMTSDHMQARFTGDRKSLAALQGEGHVNVQLSDDSGRKEITCDRFWSDIGPNEQIAAINAAGDPTPAHAVMDGPPKRDIVARQFRVGLKDKRVTDMHADTQVVMQELQPVPRQINGEHLVVFFDPALHKATTATVDGGFKYSDPRNQANAEKANYDIVNDLVVLTASLGFDPVVTSDGQQLKAKLIEFSPRAGTAKATGDVIGQLVSKQSGPSADATSVFPANKPVFINSDSATMRQSNKLAVFSGHVRAWQDTNTIFAEEVQVQGMGDQITARGNVRATLYNSTTGEQRKTPVLARSDNLAAHKVERRIDLLGNVKIDDEQRHITAEKSSFYFDAARKLDHIEAEEKVVMIDQSTGRKATGDKATYSVTKRLVTVSGSPANVTDPKGNLSGQQIAIDLTRNKVDVMSPTQPTQGTLKSQ